MYLLCCLVLRDTRKFIELIVYELISEFHVALMTQTNKLTTTNFVHTSNDHLIYILDIDMHVYLIYTKFLTNLIQNSKIYSGHVQKLDFNKVTIKYDDGDVKTYYEKNLKERLEQAAKELRVGGKWSKSKS